MQTIAQQNNTAVVLMRSEDFEAAVKISLETLRSLKQLVDSIHTNNCSQNSDPDSLDQAMVLPDQGGQYDFSNRNDFIYDQGIMMGPNALQDPFKIAVILIFNAALANHLCAKQCPENSTLFMLQARSLYAMAYQLQRTSKDNTLFRVAVINNSAVLERELGNEQACKMFFDCLISIWSLLVHDHESGSHQQADAMRSFLWNILKDNDAAAGAA